jgi:hypothetical protein
MKCTCGGDKCGIIHSNWCDSLKKEKKIEVIKITPKGKVIIKKETYEILKDYLNVEEEGGS